MEVVKRRYTYRGRNESYRVIPIGDIHLGAKGCDEDALIETVQSVAKDDHALVVYMGDMAECILSDDKRWDDRCVADWCYEPWARANIALAQRDRLISTLKSIPSDRVLGIIEGNHELTLRSRHRLDLTLDLSRELNIPYLAQDAFVEVTFSYPRSHDKRDVDNRSRRFTIFATHGHGGGRKPGGKVNKMVDLGAFIDADIVFVGHHHDRLSIRSPRLGIDRGGNFVSRDRLCVMTGTYLKTYQIGSPSYGARELYPPTAIGSPIVTITPNDRRMEVTT